MARRQSHIFALLFALVLAAPVAAQRNQDRDRSQDRTGTSHGKPRRSSARSACRRAGTIRLKTFSGRVNITGGAGNQVVIKAVRRATRQRLDDIKLEITQTGNVVEIDANHRQVDRRNDNVVSTDFDIQVPSQAKLDLKTFSAPITVTGVAGDTIVDGFSSDIRLAEVAGPMRVKTFSGGVTLEAKSWSDGDDLNVNTFSGDVTLQPPRQRARADRLRQLQRDRSTATCR